MLNPNDFYQSLTTEAGSLLISRNQTLAVAESVTAGQLQTSFSLAEGAMDFFQGGITAYNLGQKSKHLGIDPIHATCTDCVSENIAAAMAIHAARLFNCQWGIGITGYASPVPEKNIEELFACYAISFGSEIKECATLKATKKQPLEVRQFYTHEVLNRLLAMLKTGD